MDEAHWGGGWPLCITRPSNVEAFLDREHGLFAIDGNMNECVGVVGVFEDKVGAAGAEALEREMTGGVGRSGEEIHVDMA